ncbi:hypothetical protein ACFL5O_10595 [Myxococcota bacterium]
MSVVRASRVSSVAEGNRKRISKLAGRAVRLLHRWDLVPAQGPRGHQSGTFSVWYWTRRRYLVYEHEGKPAVLQHVLASFATLELAQAFLWSEMDNGNLSVAILDQETQEVITDPMPEPARVKLSQPG